MSVDGSPGVAGSVGMQALGEGVDVHFLLDGHPGSHDSA
jgi:hypothetical protein